ncbi:adenylosuccinate synthase [Paenibacillus humicola]|uniref:adenylosuccinate synthase n=1 Tax=Paenibacillus humicola TaxID=3110540 RepID=UPI00237B60A7|nr:adenylosuccinate synthase [Paenibacillus humicola]
MSVTAVVGAGWGDEGKGKMTDALAAVADMVVRFQGGSNAGHTILNEWGKFGLRLLPSGVFRQGVVNVIGPAVALNPDDLFRELDGLAERGVPAPDLRISERAQIVLPYHKLLDALEEERLGARRFGSTRSGIAPFYADKALKIGVQAADLMRPGRLEERLQAALKSKNLLLHHLYGEKTLDAARIAAELHAKAQRLAPYLGDTTTLLNEALKAGKRVLAEGQLGALRDVDHGIFPFTTSVSTLAGYAAAGAGVPPQAITRIVAVTKAYTSAVGEGPLVAELTGREADELRRRGGDAGEFGVVTGRPRRVGWFDAVAAAYGCLLQGATEVALTNLDVLGYLADIPVCTAYRIGGQETDRFPAPALLEAASPVWKRLSGWKTDISGIRRYGELPANARRYVDFIEERIGVPVRWISIGPRREQLIDSWLRLAAFEPVRRRCAARHTPLGGPPLPGRLAAQERRRRRALLLRQDDRAVRRDGDGMLELRG